MHIVGTVDTEGALASQVVESLRMLDFAEDLCCGGPGRGDRPGSADDLGRIADVGSGFGFPALLWKGARKDLVMTLIERKEKSATFLELLSAKIGSDGTNVICADAAAVPVPGSFSIVTSKAAGKLEIMLPIAERLASPGGLYITVKGEGWRREMASTVSRGMELLEVRAVTGMAGELVAFRRKG